MGGKSERREGGREEVEMESKRWCRENRWQIILGGTNGEKPIYCPGANTHLSRQVPCTCVYEGLRRCWGANSPGRHVPTTCGLLSGMYGTVWVSAQGKCHTSTHPYRLYTLYAAYGNTLACALRGPRSIAYYQPITLLGPSRIPRVLRRPLKPAPLGL